MIRILSAFALSVAAALSIAASAVAADQPLTLADNAPNRYTVVSGDTLWDISGKFLKDPWRWPDIWRMNRDQIKNPHRIYPGDVIALERDANGTPYLRLESRLGPRVYSEQIEDAIPPIPPNVIEPFIAAPLVIEGGELDRAARIVATQEDRVMLGRGDTAYVANADPSQKRWQIYRNGQPLLDPENPKRILGYEAFHLGQAMQTQVGNPAVFTVENAKQEIGQGDRLMPMTKPVLVDYIPHKPDIAINGRVVSVYGGVGAGGRLSVVSISRGSAEGVNIGHILALERNRIVATRDENDRKQNIVIPPLRFGLLFVFRTFDHISYALVLQSDGTVENNDFVRTP